MKQYKYNIKDEDLFLDCISVVDTPAVESNFHIFDKVKMNFKVEGNNIVGCILRCDHPILRFNESTQEYYEIVFTKEVCDHFLQQMLHDTSSIWSSLNHDGNNVQDKLTLTGLFQKSSYVNVDDDCVDGSVYAQFRVNDPNLLNDIKEGKFCGFSVEIYYSDLVPLSPLDRAISIAQDLK